MAIRQILSSFFSSKSDQKVRRTRGVRFSAPGVVEQLETRQMLSATQDVAGLRFVTTGTFTATGTEFDSTSPVQVGFSPDSSSSFKPLLNIPQGVKINSTTGQESFTTVGDLSVISGTTSQVIVAGPTTLNIDDLLVNGSVLSSGTQSIKVAGEQFTANRLTFGFAPGTETTNDSVVYLGGAFNFPALGNDGFNLDGVGSYVAAGIGNSLQATIDSSLTLRANFTVDGLSFSNTAGVSYSTATDILSLQGSSSFQFRGNTFVVSIGSAGKPGLTIANGQITSFDFTSDSDFKIGTASFKTSNLGASYLASTDTFTIKGTASATMGANTISVGFGAGGSAGIVISNGQLQQLGFLTTSSLSAGGMQFNANPLIATYVDATDAFTLKGNAVFQYGTAGSQRQSIDIGLGEAATSGLQIAAGSVTQIGGVIHSNLSLGGLSFNSSGLTTTYVASSNTLTIAGNSSFQTRGSTIQVQLGSTVANGGIASRGMVIQNGNLSSLDAAVTGGFTIGAAKLSANALGLTYDDAGKIFKINGTATLSFSAGKSQSMLNLTLGRSGVPGMLIANGQFQQLDMTINGDFEVQKLKFTAKSLNLTYDANSEVYTAKGGASFTARGNIIDVDLSAPGMNGLVITNGRLTALDAAVTGGFSFANTSFTAQSLRFTYDQPSATFFLNGGANLAFKIGNTPSNLQVTFGVNGQPGIAFVDGSFQQMNLRANGNIAASGLTIPVNNFVMTYNADTGIYTAKGQSSFTARGTKFVIDLGGPVAGEAPSQGLVIKNGSLSALDSSVTGRFSFGNVNLAAQSLRLIYDQPSSSIFLNGGMNLAFKIGRNPTLLKVTLGANGQPGIAFANGTFQQINMKVDGNIAVGGLTFTPTNLVMTYNVNTGIYTARGGASFTTRGSTLNVNFGSTAANGVATDGLIIQNGSLQKLDAAVTGGFSFANAQFNATALRFTYITTRFTSTFVINGKANLTFKVGNSTSTMSVIFGVYGQPGISINDGSFQQMNLKVDGNFVVSGLTITATNVLLTYAANSGIFTASGEANFKVRGTTVNVELGGRTPNGLPTAGLVVKNGSLQTLDAAVTGEMSLSSVAFRTRNLRFTFQNDGGTTSFTVSGLAQMEFKSGSATNNLTVTFGANGSPGLQIVNGTFQSLAITVDSNLSISSIQFSTRNLAINYDATTGVFTMSGLITVLARQTQFQLLLGNSNSLGIATAGLVIQNGQLKTFDGAITGGFQVSNAEFTTRGLRFTYLNNNGQTQFSIQGAAAFSFNTGRTSAKVDVTFGTTTAPGLVFVNGHFQSMDLLINSDIVISSVAFHAKNLAISYNANSSLFTASGALSFELRGQKVNLQLGQNGTAGLVIRYGSLEQLDAAVTSNLEFSKVQITTSNLRFQWSNFYGNTTFQLTGGASVAFTVSGKTSKVAVQFGVSGYPGLVITNGSFRYMTLRVDGDLSIAGVTITARNLTFKYDADLSEFIMFGSIGVSTASKGGQKSVLDNVSATLGSGFDAPGIEIKSGTLTRLDIALNGTINLGPLSATAKSLRVVYTQNDGNMFITGDVDVTFAKRFHFGVGFPGRGLQINTNTGQVDLNGLRLSLGGIRVHIFELKDFTIWFTDSGNGNFSVGGSVTVTVGQILEYRGDVVTEFQNNQLSSLGFKLRGNPGLLIGALQIRELDASISGLADGDMTITGRIHAIIPVVANINLLTLDGDLSASSAKIVINANAVIYNDKLLKGNASIVVDLQNSRFDFRSNVTGLAGVLKGNAFLGVDMKTGFFDAGADLGVFVPDQIPVIGGKSIGGIGIHAAYGLKQVAYTQVILPKQLTGIGTRVSSGLADEGFSLYANRGALLSPDGTYELKLQGGQVVIYDMVLGTSKVISNGQGNHAIFQYDGNFVLYDNGKPVWSSATSRNYEAHLSLGNDGKLHVVSRDFKNVVWTVDGDSLKSRERMIAVVARIAAEPNAETRSSMISNLYRGFGVVGVAKRLQMSGLSESLVREFVNQTQAKRFTQNARFLSLDGHVSFLGVDFWPNYVGNLDSNAYQAWIDYDPPILPKGRIDITSNGNPGGNGIQIVTSFSPPRSQAIARQTATPLALMAPANTVYPTSTNDTLDTTIALEAFELPTGSIQAVTVNAATNSASIKFKTTSAFTGSVTLFVDTQSSGYQGRQIDPGLSTADGVQTFNWQDVADSLPASFQHGQKLYFYLKVDDGLHSPFYSKYSAGVSAPQDAPTIGVPTAQETTSNQALVFSSTEANAITITDPVANDATDNQLFVIVKTTGEGTLTLGKLPATVTVVGNGSDEVELTGKASDINAALDGLTYTSLSGSNADTLTVEVRRADSSFLASFVSSDVNIQINDIQVSGLKTFDINPNGTTQTVFGNVTLDDVVTDTIQSARVTIKNYHEGVDFLTLDHTGIEDLIHEGISAVFNSHTGTLYLTGGAFREATAERLLQNVQFSTTDPSTTKSLVIDLHDNAGNVEDATQTLV